MTRSDPCDQEELMEVVRSVGLEVVRWETTVRCSTHYFTVLRRHRPGELGQEPNRKL